MIEVETVEVDTQALNQLSVDFLLLADRAEAINGKLYMMGGAWDNVAIQDFDQPTLISMAIGILVPWNATNQQHALRIVIEDSDGNPVEFRLEAGFAAGRHPLAPPGLTQRVILTVPVVPVRFPRPGTYVIRAYINEQAAKRTEFQVVTALPVPALSQP